MGQFGAWGETPGERGATQHCAAQGKAFSPGFLQILFANSGLHMYNLKNTLKRSFS